MKTGARPQGPDPTSRAILLSKRATAFLVERARVMQKDGRLLFPTQRGEEIEQFFNIPYKNTAFLLLGLGTSITESAVRLLAESSVMVGFVGTGGSPLLGAVDPVFMTPQSEYRPTESMQDWMRMWLDEPRRLAMGRQFMKVRAKWVQAAWKNNPALRARSRRNHRKYQMMHRRLYVIKSSLVSRHARGLEVRQLRFRAASWVSRHARGLEVQVLTSSPG